MAKKVKITPVAGTQNRVVVEAAAAEEKTAGGIIIPDTAKEKPQEAKVVAVGKGKVEDGKVIAPEVKIGDLVLFGKYAGTEIKMGDKEYLILKEEDILAIVG